MRDFWSGQSDGVAELASRLTGSQRPVPARRPRPVRDASTSSPRTTASRCATWSPTTTSTTRPTARTTATAPTTTARWNCGVEGPTDDPAIAELRAAPAAQLPRHAAAVAGRADAARRRRDGPHAGRQQQRLLPGQRDLAGSTGSSTRTQRGLLEFTRRLIALRRDHPVFHRRDFFGGQRRRRARPAGHPLVPRRRARDEPPRLAQPGRCATLGVFLNGEELPNPGAERRAGDRRLVRAAGQRRPRGRAVPAARAALRQPLAPGDLHRRAGGARGPTARWPARSEVPARRRARSCCCGGRW